MTEHEHVDLIESRLKEYRHIIIHGVPPASMVKRRADLGADAKPVPRTLAQVQAEILELIGIPLLFDMVKAWKRVHPRPDSAFVAHAMEAAGAPQTVKIRKRHPRARSRKDMQRKAFRRPRTT